MQGPIIFFRKNKKGNLPSRGFAGKGSALTHRGKFVIILLLFIGAAAPILLRKK